MMIVIDDKVRISLGVIHNVLNELGPIHNLPLFVIPQQPILEQPLLLHELIPILAKAQPLQIRLSSNVIILQLGDESILNGLQKGSSLLWMAQEQILKDIHIGFELDHLILYRPEIEGSDKLLIEG